MRLQLDMPLTIRKMGHAGIGAQHCAYDRALCDPLLKLTHQRHMALVVAGEAKAQCTIGAPQSLQWLRLWIVGTGGCAHDFHNWLKWGMYLEFSDVNLTNDVCIVVQSVRHGYHQLVTHLGAWIVQRLQVVEDCIPESVSEVVWLTLGAEAEWAITLSELGLLYKAGNLQSSHKAPRQG